MNLLIARPSASLVIQFAGCLSFSSMSQQKIGSSLSELTQTLHNFSCHENETSASHACPWCAEVRTAHVYAMQRIIPSAARWVRVPPDRGPPRGKLDRPPRGQSRSHCTAHIQGRSVLAAHRHPVVSSCYNCCNRLKLACASRWHS